MNQSPSIHASAVLVGARAVLIQGPAGSGKSRLALALLHAAGQGLIPFARLVADDRAHVEAAHGRLLVRPAPALAGLIEVRGLGIRRVPYEPLAVVGILVELGAARRRTAACSGRGTQAVLAGITLPRLAVAAGADPLLPGAGLSANRPIRPDFGTAGGSENPRKAPYMRVYGVPLKPPAGPFTAMQQPTTIGPRALELGLWIMMIAARSCGATAPAGISRR